VAALVAAFLSGSAPARATDEESLEERVRRLERRLEQQDKELETLRAAQTPPPEKAAAPEKAAEPGTFRFFWKDGVRAETTDGNFELRLGGRTQADFAFFSEDEDVKSDVGEVENGAEFRRARLHVGGTIYERVTFQAEYDFAGGEAEFKDVYMGLLDLPYVGDLLVGHFKEPFSLEELTSSRFITFMERALPNAFSPSRNMGIMLANAVFDERATWAMGVFRDSDDFGSSSEDGGFNFTGRLTGLPYFTDGGRRLVHLGAAYSHGDPEGDEIGFSQRPEAHLAPRFVDTGDVPTDGLDRMGLEAAWVHGPFSLQGEYLRTWVDTSGATPSFDGYYVQASYFITGEHRPYKTGRGSFDRVRVNRPFLFGEGGPGAWEVATRYSAIDLSDEDVRGGRLSDVTGGVNWHLDDNVRVSANYVWANLHTVGDTHALQTRFQIDF
jgi:phosphate-selective porin OprO/OprP